MNTEKKFLIVRLSAIGDIVHSLTVADCLRTFYPNAQIDWVVSDKCRGLIENNPLINNVYVADISKWRKNWLFSIPEIIKFTNIIKKKNYDYALDVQGLFKSAVITALSGAKEKIGMKDGREFSTIILDKKVEPIEKRPCKNHHIIKRNLDILTGSNLVTKEDMANYIPKIELPPSSCDVVEKINNLLKNIDKTKPVFVFAPATMWENKHWDVNEWQKLFQMVKNSANIIFTGVKKDLKLINTIINCEENKNIFILAGKTNMEEYVEVLRRADLILSPDSGASHLGFGVIKNGKPKIFTLFFATSKNVYTPLGEGNLGFPLKEPACAPCHKRKCKKGTMECTKYIKAEDVYSEIKKSFNL